MTGLYRNLLYLYPSSYRYEFGDEMTFVFVQALDDMRQRRFAARVSFSCREIAGLFTGALRTHLRQHFGFNDWLPFRRFDMRPGFRFPRSTVFLMWVILAGVLMAIEQAKVIVNKLSYGALPRDVISVWNGLPWFLFLAVALMCVSVAAVWGVLFALRRTGMQRLDDVQTGHER